MKYPKLQMVIRSLYLEREGHLMVCKNNNACSIRHLIIPQPEKMTRVRQENFYLMSRRHKEF